jgi:hypothetical protein
MIATWQRNVVWIFLSPAPHKTVGNARKEDNAGLCQHTH